MRLYIDLQTGSLVESPNFPNPITTLTVKRGASTEFEVSFLDENRQVIELAENASGALGIKEVGKYDADYIVSALSWEKEGSGETSVYKFSPNFNTIELNALIGHDGTTSNDKVYVELMGEIVWNENGKIFKTKTFTVHVDNDINKGSEENPTSANPAYPAPDAIELQANKGQPNGYPSLDGEGKVPTDQLPDEDINISDVDGLQASLDGKANLTDPRFSDARTPLSHTHSESDITNLTSDLSSKVSTTDPRLSDARTPTAHAASHATGGSDVIPNAASNGNAGLMTGADKAKLESISSAALLVLGQTTNQGMQLQMGLRKVLTANTTYYVATTGSNNNDGLSASTPFLTLQKAINVIGALDLNGKNVTIQIADGTYVENVVFADYVGRFNSNSGQVTISGNATTPSNVILQGINSPAIYCYCAFNPLYVQNLKLQTSGTGFAPCLGIANATCYYSNIVFGPAAANAHIYVENGYCRPYGNWTIAGDAPKHIDCELGGIFYNNYGSRLITISGALTFLTAFIQANNLSCATLFSATFVGDITSGELTIGTTYRIGSVAGGADFTGVGASSNAVGVEFVATGTTPIWGSGNLFIVPVGSRYRVAINSCIYSNGAGANYYPGSIAGSISTNGVYV